MVDLENRPGTTLSVSGSNFLGMILTFKFSKRVKMVIFGRFFIKKVMVCSRKLLPVRKWSTLGGSITFPNRLMACVTQNSRHSSAAEPPRRHLCNICTFKYFERATPRGGYFLAGRIRTSYRTNTSVGGTSQDLKTTRGGCRRAGEGARHMYM